MRFNTITKANVHEVSDAMLLASIGHYRVIESNALQAGPLARGLHRRQLARSCGEAKRMLEDILYPEQDRRRKAGR